VEDIAGYWISLLIYTIFSWRFKMAKKKVVEKKTTKRKKAKKKK